jgi:hypothetical protein
LTTPRAEVAAAVGIAAAALHLTAAQQAPDCAQSPRRGEAIQLARQNHYRSGAGARQPEGVSVKDEACGFGVFSDQRGLIYIGQTMK